MEIDKKISVIQLKYNSMDKNLRGEDFEIVIGEDSIEHVTQDEAKNLHKLLEMVLYPEKA